MIITTGAVVLQTFSFSDTKIIAKLFTEDYGLLTFIVVKGSKKNKQSNLLHPLALVRVTFSYKEKKSMQFLSNAEPFCFLQSIRYEPNKIAIVFFMAEILIKAIKEQEQNLALFNFISESIRFLDLVEDDYLNFHLVFLVRLASFLGFAPEKPEENKESLAFDLEKGCFSSQLPLHLNIIEKEHLENFETLLQTGFSNLKNQSFPYKIRTYLLDKLLLYYQLHIGSMDKITTLQVLRSL